MIWRLDEANVSRELPSLFANRLPLFLVKKNGKVFASFENNQSNSIMAVQLVECWPGHYNFVGSNPYQADIVIKDE